jgi:hypothetical protein
MLGGLLILGGGISMWLVVYLLTSNSAPGIVQGALGAGYSMLQKSGFSEGFDYVLAVSTGIVSGILIVYASLMLRARPERALAWGRVILVFSFVSLVGIGGFGIGAVLGILGGAMAYSWDEKLRVTRLRRRREIRTIAENARSQDQNLRTGRNYSKRDNPPRPQK